MLIRTIYWILILYLVYLVWKFIRSPRRRANRPQQEAKRLPQMMVKDETCNTYLPIEEALKETYQGRDYYFCSKDCRQKFLDNRKSGS